MRSVVFFPTRRSCSCNTQSSAKHEVRSDQSGQFQFAGLPAGDYQLETRLPGFAGDQGRVTLEAGQNLHQDVVFQVGSLSGDDHTIGSPGGAADAAISARKADAQPEIDPCSQSAAGGCIDAADARFAT